MGKPAGQDAALDRPSAVREFGLSGAIARLEDLLGRGGRRHPGLPRGVGAARGDPVGDPPAAAAQAVRTRPDGVRAPPHGAARRRPCRHGASGSATSTTGCWPARGSSNWPRAFPLTRPIARRRVRALFDLCAGFVYTQALLACVRLRVFEILRDGPLTSASLAARLGLSPDAAATTAAGGGLAEAGRAPPRWALGAGRARRRHVGNPGVTAMVEHHALVYRDLADPVALLRRDRAATAFGLLALCRGRARPPRCRTPRSPPIPR